MDTYEKNTTRHRLAEKSKTPKGRAAYEKVAEEMRKQSYEEELEEEIQSFWNRASGFQPKFVTLEVKENGFAVIARHFAQWGVDHTPLPEDTVIYNKGVEEGKRLMTEDAVAVEVVGDKRDLRLIDSTQRCLFNAKRGDWLKIIIVKED